MARQPDSEAAAPAYDGLAAFYDEFQESVDNPARAAMIDCLARAYGCGELQGDEGQPLLLDLGCGTGALFAPLRELGYDLIGIDNSSLMLTAARDRFEDSEYQPLLLLQDITDFELFGTVNVITCLLDTVNHVLERQDLLQMFRRCKTYLQAGGLFIFDVLTEEHLAERLGQQQFFSVSDERSLFWQHDYTADTGLSRAAITVFEAVGSAREKVPSDCLYRRSDFVIAERYYPADVLLHLLAEAGFATIERLEQSRIEKSVRPGRAFFIAQ